MKFYFGDEFPESDDILTIDKDYQIKDSINKYIVLEEKISIDNNDNIVEILMRGGIL